MRRSRYFFGLFILALSLNAYGSGPSKCSDLFKEVEQRLQSRTLFEQDFGPGVFVRKVSNEEFRIDPPPEVAKSARQAQIAVGTRSQHGGQIFTILFDGFSEGEVLSFRAMMHRDSRIKSDDDLTSILLGGYQRNDKAEYAEIRNRARTVRDQMMRRYRWSEATVEAQPMAPGGREEKYVLTAHHDSHPDAFLLRIKLKAAKMLKSRAPKIAAILAKPEMVDATVEQAAHQMLSELKKTDSGITEVSLKVLTGDFVIAQK